MLQVIYSKTKWRSFSFLGQTIKHSAASTKPKEHHNPSNIYRLGLDMPSSGNPHGPLPETNIPRTTRRRIEIERRAGDRVVEGDPYGVLSGIGSGQVPMYRSTGQQVRNGWAQSDTRNKDRVHKRSDFTSTDGGRRDGGEFGLIVNEHYYDYTPIYPGEATTDPEFLERRMGPDEGSGWGELIPGLYRGNEYGYRIVGPHFALANWGNHPEPHIPGRGGFVYEYSRDRGSAADSGYCHGIGYDRHTPPRGFSGRDVDDMEGQLPRRRSARNSRSGRREPRRRR